MPAEYPAEPGRSTRSGQGERVAALLNPDRFKPTSRPRQGDAGYSLIDLSTLIGIARRRYRLIVGFALAGVALALLLTLTTTSLFTAGTDILIDTRNAFELDKSPSNANSTLITMGMDTANVDSQVEILKSERIASLVLRKLKLERDPEFLTPGSLLATAAGKLRSVLSVFSDPLPDDRSRIPREVIEEFQDRLDVKRSAQTYVLNVSFRARTRERAALIANEIANAYLTDQLQSKYDATRRASRWLQDRIKELRQNVLVSDAAVQTFRAENNIVSTGAGRLVSEQQVSDMSTQLAASRAATAEVEAKYNRLKSIVDRGDADAATTDTLTSEIFTRLRDNYNAVSKRLAEVSDRLGSNHPAVVNLRSEMANLRRLTLDELTRSMEGMRSAKEVAKAHQTAIERSLADLSGESAVSDKAQIQLRELEREAATNRTLYETFLERYKTALQQESFPITDARILSEASPPRLKSNPKTFLIVALGLFGGMAAGFATALVKELSDNVFRSPQHLESALEVPCIGILPTVSSRRRASATRAKARPGLGVGSEQATLPEDIGLFRYAVDEPFTRFAETLRSIKLAASATSGVGRAKILAMVSTMPGEGKSTVAMNLAQILAHSGKRVLLIDADLRSPSLSESVARGSKGGLAEVLDGTVSFSDAILADPITGLQFLPSIRSTDPHAADLLGSYAMQSLLQSATTAFDYVIIDPPPLVPIIDVRVLAPLIDEFVFVAKWGATPVVTATQALAAAPTIADRLIGSVLNQVDLKALRLHTDVGDRTYSAVPAYRNYVND